MRTISLEEEVAYLAAASEPLKDIAWIILDTGMRLTKFFESKSRMWSSLH